MALVLARAPLEPRDVECEHRRPDPRAQRGREPGEEDEMPEVHRISRPAVWPRLDDAIGRIRKARPSAAQPRAIRADPAILEITPREERQGPPVDRRHALLQRGLRREHDHGPDDERAVRGALQPALWRHAGFGSASFGIARLKRLATTMVPAGNQKGASSP